MPSFSLVFRKEFRDTFLSPLPYILGAVFLLITGIMFFNIINLQQESPQAMVGIELMAPLFGNINTVLLFLAPLLSMRALSDEKKQRTLDLLFGAGLGASQILWAKFLNLALTLMALMLLTLVFPVVMSLANGAQAGEIFRLYGVGFLGTFLMGLCYLVLGLFFSTLTTHAMLAALLTYGSLLFMVVLSFMALTIQEPLLSSIVSAVPLVNYFEGFARGVVRLDSLVYLGSFLVFFFFLSLRSLKMYFWK